MSGASDPNAVDAPLNERDADEPQKKWNYKKIGLIAGVIVILLIIVIVLVVVLTGSDEVDETTITPTTETVSSSSSAPPLPGSEITLNDILTGTLSSNSFTGNWITGKDVLINDDEGLKMFDVLTETYTLLLAKEDSELFTKAFTYTLSPGNTHLLIGYEPNKFFRHSFEALYSVVGLLTVDGKLKAAGQETKIFIDNETDKLSLVQWSPSGLGLVMVYKNNIYYKPNLDTNPIQITTDGSPEIFNGVPDWVYEEEVFRSNSALRFSPDGTKLAYVRFDDTNVETFEYTYYGETQYPTKKMLAYPKVGTANPTVQVHEVFLPNNAIYPIRRILIPVPTEISTVDHIISTLSWANNDQLVATWMNRVQNEAFIEVCTTSMCSEISHIAPTVGWVKLFSAPLYNKDGTHLALIMSHDQGDEAGSYRHLTILSIDDDTQMVLTKGKYVVTELIYWDVELNYIFYSANTEDDSRVSHIYAIKVEQDAESQCLTCNLDALELGESGDYKYFSASFSKDEKLFGLNALGPAIPRSDIFSYSETGNAIIVKHERVWETNEALHEKIGNMATPFPIVEYDDDILLSSGYTAQVSMILPGNIDRSGATKYPMLINVYGGPDSHSVTFQWGTNWGTYLAAAKGIIYVKIDGRGSGLRGDKLLNEIYRKLGTVEIEDQIETAKLLAEKYSFIHRDYIAIWGWSYGGYVAGLALAKDIEHIFKSAVSVAPVTDWTYYDTIYTERYMGLPSDNPEGYDASRLSTLYEEFEGKNLFLIHGTLDDNVHYQQAMSLSRTLEKHAVLFKQMTYPDEDHSLSGVLLHFYTTLERYFSDCFDLPDETTTTTTQTDPSTTTETSTEITTPPPLTGEITLDDILTGSLASRRFSSKWVTGIDVLVNDTEGLKLSDVLTGTETLLLATEDSDLFSKAYVYSLSSSHTHLLVGYDPIKSYRHSFEASYSIVELRSDGATLNSAEQETKIFINDETDKLSLVQWSPTGQGLVIIFKNNIYYKPTVIARPIQITQDGSTQIFNGVPDWVYEEEVFGSNSAVRFSPDGTKLAYIRFDDTNVETFEYTYYGEPGEIEAQYPINKQISYPKAGTKNPTVNVYKVDLTSNALYPIRQILIPVPAQLSTVDHIISTISWANNDQIVTSWLNRVQNEAYIQVCDYAPICSVIGHAAADVGWVELSSTPLYSKDGSQLALIMSHDQGGNAGGFRHLTVISIDDNTQMVLTKGKYVVTELIYWDVEFNYIFYSANTADDSRVSHIYAIKVEQDAESQCLTCNLDALGLGESGDYKYFSASFSKDAKLFGLNALGPDVPRADIFSYSETGNAIIVKHERVWETNEALHEKIANLAKPFPTVEYDDDILLSSGYTVQVSMILPGNIDRSGATKYPMLIDVYGGPDSYSVTFQWGANFGTYLAAANDIIYVKIDGRGSGLRGDKLLNEIYRKLGTVEIDDQIETAKLLADKYSFVDRDYIAIWGWSYGGYAAGLVLAKDTQSLFKCAAAVAPVTDWTYYDTIYTERYMGLPSNNPEGYDAACLSTLYEEFEGKNLFLIHGTLDDNVHYQQAMALSRTLERHVVLFKQMTYPDEDHSLSGILPHLYSTLEHYFIDCFHLDP